MFSFFNPQKCGEFTMTTMVVLSRSLLVNPLKHDAFGALIRMVSKFVSLVARSYRLNLTKIRLY